MVWRKWDGKEEIDLEGLSAVINLSGEAIDQRWTNKRKALFRKSRVDLTANLSRAIMNSDIEVLLNASATGIYGDRGDEGLPERASAGRSYLAELCRDWEDAVEVPENVRTVFLRTGVVLGKDSRAWEKMSKIFKWQDRQDLNLQPSVLETDALPIELLSYLCFRESLCFEATEGHSIKRVPP